MSEVVLVVLLGVAIAGGLAAVVERNRAVAECVLLRTRIEALEKRRVEDFVAGAKWWEYDRENATMWQSDQERGAAAAEVHFKAQALREAALAAEEKKP